MNPLLDSMSVAFCLILLVITPAALAIAIGLGGKDYVHRWLEKKG